MKNISCLLLVAALLLACTVESNQNDFNKYFEIYEPQGLIVWYPKTQGLMGIGVDISVIPNKKSKKLRFNIHLNATTSSYGKFIICDDNAVIKAGDLLKYRFTLMFDNETSPHDGRFRVADAKIYHQHERCPSTTSTSTTEVDLPEATSLEEDLQFLESIVKDVLQHCSSVTATSKNLYLDSRPAPNLDPEKLYNFTLNELKTMLPKINWIAALVHTFYYNDGVGFEVKNDIEKLKVLKLSKSINLNAIRDMDDMDQSTDTPNSNIDYLDVSGH